MLLPTSDTREEGDAPEAYYVHLNDGKGTHGPVRLTRVYIGQEFGAHRRSWVIVDVDDEQHTARAEPA
jgi:hypothetical protein